MNYRKHYNQLMKRAKGRVLEGYSERHHVKPRCMGGTDDGKNLVQLTPEEHYVAHLLLVKIHPSVRGLLYAVFMMSGSNCSNNKLYGWVRRRMNRLGLSEEHKKKISKTGKGRKHSEETKRKIALGNTGKIFSDERRRNLSKGQAAWRASPAGKEWARKNGIRQKGKKLTEEHKRKIGLAGIGRQVSEETRKKISEAQIGKPRFTEEQKRGLSAVHKGQHLSEEAKVKLSVAFKGREMSEDTRRKISANGRKPKLTPAQAVEIFKRLNGSETRAEVAKAFGVSCGAVDNIRAGKTFAESTRKLQQ